MPGTNELLGLVVVIFVVWILLKVARVAIRLIVVMILIVVIVASFYWFFMR